LEAHGTSPVWCIRSEWGIKNRIKDFIGRVEHELTIFSRSPDLLKEYKSELKSVEVLRIRVEKKERFEELGFDVTEMKEGSEKFFKDTVIDGISQCIDCLMIADDRSSIVIGTIGGERLAIIIKLPIVSLLQKAVWESMV